MSSARLFPWAVTVIRYDEGAKLYSMGLHSFQELAKEANAVYHVKRIVLVNTEVIDAYLENFKD